MKKPSRKMEWKNKELENMSEKMRHDSGPACFYRGSGKRKLKKKLEEIKDTFTHTFLTFPTLQTTKALWVQSRLNKHMSGSVIKHIFLIFQNTKEQERMLKDSRNGSGIGNWLQRWFLEDKRMIPSWFGRNFDSVPNKLQIQYEGKIKAF